MDEENNQKELFEFKKPKRSFPKLSNFLPKADFERNILITLSLEKVIFIFIGMIMAMVVVYALGVEIGRSRAEERIVSRVAAKKTVLLPVPAKPIQAKAKAYVIIAGAFTRKDNAMISITRLRQAGYDAYLGQDKPLFQVWVNGKAGTDPAKELARIKQYYKDAYLKTK